MSATFLGMPPFPTAAKAALADSQLRANLAHATATIRAKRAAVVAEVEDWEGLRHTAAATKDTTLAHLDSHLERLEAALAAAGATVHRAADAAAACAIVADIARSNGVDEVVKVKSMATQEIGLNEALAAEGISAWETDLAELIVQLGDDLPSHILVPAIHRNRAEIREIFTRAMGQVGRPAPTDLSDSPAELAGAARAHLRERFLRARMAVSGANFAVAETGTLVVVESEGNGRMCLTLPEVLVSVVGIEKVVPSWADLAPFLQLLPRSSTGERMNPYTSMWTGVTPGDGPQQVHVVLLDNGRSDVLADPVGRQALRCIRCSACLNVCPVYERVGGHAYGSVYPGPIGAILTPMLRGVGHDPATDALPFASTLCGACLEVCPVRIDIPEVLVHLRGKVVDAHRAGAPGGTDLAMRGAGWVTGRSSRMAAMQRLAGMVGSVLSGAGRRTGAAGGPALGRLPWPVSRWSQARDAPAPASESFRAWWRRTSGGAGAGPADAAVANRPQGGGPDADPVTSASSPPQASEDTLTEPLDLVDLFAERVADYRAVVHRAEPAQVEGLIAGILPAGSRVVVPAGFPAEAVPDAVTVLHDRPEDPLTAEALDGVDAVLTTSALGIAVTGTVVLDHGPGQGRRALSLVPDTHICLVRADGVVADVPDAVARLDPTRPLTWISGPSATSDIELSRVEGVHGPRTLHVVVVSG